MPCDAHTIFYRGCGHVFLAQSQSLEPESPTSSKHQNVSHTSPTNYPCNRYLPYTINICSSSCQECTTLPKGFEMQSLGADPNDIEVFDTFNKQWLQEVESNVKMEGNLRDAALKTVKDSATGRGEKMSEKKGEVGKNVGRGKEKEENLLDWEDAEGRSIKALASCELGST